jgi:hypothetical protein
LESDNVLNAGSETLWAEPFGDDIYRLQNSPFSAFGFSYLDKVRAVGSDIPTVCEVVESSGNSTYRIKLSKGVIDSEQFKQYWQKLDEIGCTYEGFESKLLSIDVPSTTDIYTAYAIFEAGESIGLWEFEEAKCAHNTGA